MKNLLVRINDDLHAEMEAIAKRRGKTFASVLREALYSRIQSEPFAKAGRKLMSVDQVSGEKVELVILGLTHRRKK